MQLIQAFRLREKEIIALVGAGGKTSALFRLADELGAQGKRVALTTTTQLAATQAAHAGARVLQYASTFAFLARVRTTLTRDRRVVIVGADIAENKVAGVPPEFIDTLALEADAVIYEADGARQLPFKAPAAHEPVIANATRLVVSVIGASVFGTPLDDAHVHRAALVAQIAGARIGDPVTPLLAARVLAHSSGGLKNKPAAARAIVLINQVDDAVQLTAARALAHLLLGYDGVSAVAIGALRDPSQPIRETHRRVAAIILAAGAGTRMGGRIKQLLPWRGTTLIEHALDLALRSDATETIAVLGAHAETIRPLIEHRGARIAFNRQWSGGLSTSIRAGLGALAPEIDAAIFINADQPALTSDIINALIQRYRETTAPIIAPTYAGKRGSPVLFDRAHFNALTQLTGEQGGREILAQQAVELVAFDDARWGMDVDTLSEYARALEN